MLKRMLVWLIAMAVMISGLVLYDFDLLSAENLTLMTQIVIYISLPLFLVHQWVLNSKK